MALRAALVLDIILKVFGVRKECSSWLIEQRNHAGRRKKVGMHFLLRGNRQPTEERGRLVGRYLVAGKQFDV